MKILCFANDAEGDLYYSTSDLTTVGNLLRFVLSTSVANKKCSTRRFQATPKTIRSGRCKYQWDEGFVNRTDTERQFRNQVEKTNKMTECLDNTKRINKHINTETKVEYKNRYKISNSTTYTDEIALDTFKHHGDY